MDCKIDIPTSAPIGCIQLLIRKVTDGTILDNWKETAQVAMHVASYLVELLPGDDGGQPVEMRAAVPAPTDAEGLQALRSLEAVPPRADAIIDGPLRNLLIRYLTNLAFRLISERLGG